MSTGVLCHDRFSDSRAPRVREAAGQAGGITRGGPGQVPLSTPARLSKASARSRDEATLFLVRRHHHTRAAKSRRAHTCRLVILRKIPRGPVISPCLCTGTMRHVHVPSERLAGRGADAGRPPARPVPLRLPD